MGAGARVAGMWQSKIGSSCGRTSSTTPWMTRSKFSMAPGHPCPQPTKRLTMRLGQQRARQPERPPPSRPDPWRKRHLKVHRSLHLFLAACGVTLRVFRGASGALNAPRPPSSQALRAHQVETAQKRDRVSDARQRWRL